MVGTETNIVTSVEVTTSTTNDSPVLPRLLADTAERFTMAEVSADKAYLSDANLRHIVAVGSQRQLPLLDLVPRQPWRVTWAPTTNESCA